VSPNRRGSEALLADLSEAVDAAAELVSLGKERWDSERPLRLAGEAVVGRIGDIATKLPSELVEATEHLPWEQIRGIRIVVDHAYHGIDYERVWLTLRDDIPELGRVVGRWALREVGRDFDLIWGRGNQRGNDLGRGL
jgi:uncharacterized protein with HEPN domain